VTKKEKDPEIKDVSKYVDFDPEITENEQVSEALTPAERRKRGQVMRRYKSKIAAGKRRASKKRATPEKLKKRAIKKARGLIKDKLNKSKSYSEMSAAEKVALDKRMEKIPQARIDRLAKKLLPQVKKDELERMSKKKSTNEEFELFLENCCFPKRYHKLLTKDNCVNIDRRFKMYRQRFLEDENLHEVLKKVDGRWALVSRKDPSKVLQYYDGEGKPSDEWVNKVEKRVQMFKHMGEEHGAGEWGTDELTDKYKKDTPGESLNENALGALRWATKAHSGQKRRSGEPYINHPKEVARFVKQFKKSHNLDALISAAYLHDTIEDTDTTHQDLVRQFGGLIADMVKELTSDKKAIEAMGKGEYIAQKMTKMSSWALVVKLADRLANVQDIDSQSPEFQKKYANQTKVALDRLRKDRVLTKAHGDLIDAIEKKIKEYVTEGNLMGVNESFEALLEQDSCDIITMGQMKAFEKFVDRIFDKYDIDFQFTKHFGDRMSDDRNKPCIKMKELADFVTKIYKRQGKSLKAEVGAEAVIKDMQSDLNIPLVVKYDQKNDEFDIVMKTIMRKKNFKTPNKVIEY